MTEPKVHPLAYPITIRKQMQGGPVTEEVLSEVTLKRPKGKQLRQLDRAQGEMGRALALIGAVCALTEAQVDELDVEDITELGEKITSFFPGLLKTG